MNEENISLSERDSLKDFYPVLTGFKKAILPDNDVTLNIDKQLYGEKFSDILLPNTNFVTTDELGGEGTVGTLIVIHTTSPSEYTQTFTGKSLMRVKISEVLVKDSVAYAKISEYPYENDCDEDTIAVYADIIFKGLGRLVLTNPSEKLYRELPPFDKEHPNRWINKYGAAFSALETNDLFYTDELSKRLETVAVAIGVMLDRGKVKEEIEKKIQ